MPLQKAVYGLEKGRMTREDGSWNWRVFPGVEVVEEMGRRGENAQAEGGVVDKLCVSSRPGG